MPTTARANRTDGDAEAGAAEAEKCKKARVTLPVLSVLQTVLQHAAEALADKTKELTDVLGSINNDQLVAEPDVWLQHYPQRTTRRTADGSRTAQIASHGRLTACRSRLMRYPDRADDRRASLFLRRGALCILACVVQGILCSLCRFPYCSVRHMSTTLHLRIAHHSIRYTLPRTGERMCFEARIVELCGQMVDGSIFEPKPYFDAHLQGSRDST